MIRIQRRRTKGWRMPEGAVYVGRPTRWGNPYDASSYSAFYEPEQIPRLMVSDFRGLVEGRFDRLEETRPHPSIDEIRAELRGKDLACWCPLTYPDGTIVPCHADVLLELANRDEASRLLPPDREDV